MKKKLVITIAIVLAIFGAGYGFIGSRSSSSNDVYQLAEITRGNLESTISASGSLSPLTTVEVGTQVSGTIDSVFVDFNDVVKRGQLLAVLDTVLLKATVLDAEAGVERAQVAVDQAQADYDRYQRLFDRGMVSESEYLPYKVSLITQKASLKSAKATLQRAQANLEYAVIRSPINGTVIEKNVESGQTVAASLSTPTLFRIAEDMSKMEILADVDESDIGQIKEGQSVRFEVQAYSDRTFDGVVTQIRLQPTTVSNVVTYTVVVETTNNEYLLLPGMTATVDFIIDSRENVLLVPSSALRFQPSEEVVTAFQQRLERERAAMTGSDGPPPPPGGQPEGTQGERPKDMGAVWYLDENGEPVMEPLRIGMTDSKNTEIVMSRSLAEGTQVITGTGTTSSSSTRQNNSFGPPPMGGPGF